VKHSKSNAIVLAKNKMLLASGIGQTSRVDALKQAVAKAKSFGFDLNGAVMAPDAFFPFADCVEIAHQEGITSLSSQVDLSEIKIVSTTATKMESRW